jgi:hypothetical protein
LILALGCDPPPILALAHALAAEARAQRYRFAELLAALPPPRRPRWNQTPWDMVPWPPLLQ